MRNPFAITLVGISFWLLFVAALFGGDSFWGLNFSSFLDISTKVGLFVLSLVFIVGTPYFTNRLKGINLENGKNHYFRIGYLIVGFLLLNHFTIFENVYGDSVQFLTRMGERTNEYSPKFVSALFSLDLSNPKLGNLTVLSLLRLISYGFNLTHLVSFQIVGIVSGLLFYNLSFSYIAQNIKHWALQIALLVVVLLCPFNQLFLGHAEIYALAFPAVTWYLLTLQSNLERPSKKKFSLLVLTFILCVKLHYLFILLFPTLIFAINSFTHPVQVKRIVNWHFLLKYILLPIVLIGTALYFFVFKDYNDPRFLGPEVDLYDRLFLPLFSPEAPLDRYNLFSFNHIFDFVNMTFLWSAASLFLLVVFALFYAKKINWNQPILVATGFLLLLFSMVFFAFNPLLSMPMDFDLFSLAAPYLLFFGFFIIEQIQNEALSKSISGSLLGISLFSIAIFMCNHEKESLSLRMESIGKHVFKTYWIRSAGDIQLGLNLVKDHPEAYLSRSIAVVEELKPFALAGNDIEYANLLWSVGKEYRALKAYAKALNFHMRSLSYSDQLPANYIGLMESNYYLGDYQAAYHYSKELVRLNYPSEKRAYEISIDCALKSNLKGEAIAMMKIYLEKWESEYYQRLIPKE
ncbi:hypothetical protein GYB57_15170 [bacterium]|nr:hypothetical protein [bacterium]